jgi:hypothetical protein
VAPVRLLEALSQLVHGASFHVIGDAVGHSELFDMMMASLRKRKLSIPVIADDAVAPVASAFRANTDWDGVDHDAYVAFVRKLKIHGMSPIVVDAIEASYAAAAEASSSSSSDEPAGAGELAVSAPPRRPSSSSSPSPASGSLNVCKMTTCAARCRTQSLF